jgi:hypothetical protein
LKAEFITLDAHAQSRTLQLQTVHLPLHHQRFNFYSQIIGTPKVCYASERSVVDPNERQMTLKTTNVTFGSFLSMDEVLQYRPHPTDPSKTLLRQQATVSIEGIPLNRYMEDVLTKNISFNASRGRQGLEWVINKINTEVKIFCL